MPLPEDAKQRTEEARMEERSYWLGHSPSKARTTSNSTSVQHANAVKDNALGIVDVEDEEDEVSKIISWAIDAARLDPSPSSDIDSDSKSDDDASRTVDRKKKTSKKKFRE